MGMRIHEIHPSLIHAPLVFLPTAAVVDLAAASTRRRSLERLGRQFWIAGTASGLLAGMAGMAASQEVKAEDKTTRDAMFLHGLINFGIVVSALGVSLWRRNHRASVPLSVLGLGAWSIAIYSAYLGGELVYGRGLGIAGLKEKAQGIEASPPILSREAPRTFFRDIARGAGWLLEQTWRLLRGETRIERKALRVPEVEQPAAPTVSPFRPSDERRPFGA